MSLSDRRREVVNLARYGPAAPRVAERLWIDPRLVQWATQWFPARSAEVLDHWPPAVLMPYEEHPHVAFALAHWRDGRPWEETGAREYMLTQIERRGRQDDCVTEHDVMLRFARLDALYQQVRREGRLRTTPEVVPGARRESAGITIHVGPGAELLAGDSGKHRLTIARLHGLERVPVRLGVLHRSAVALLPDLRRVPASEAGSPTLST